MSETEIPKDIYGLPDMGKMTRDQMRAFVDEAQIYVVFDFKCIVCKNLGQKQMGYYLSLKNKKNKYADQRGRIEVASSEVGAGLLTCYSCQDKLFAAYDLKKKEAESAAEALPKAIEQCSCKEVAAEQRSRESMAQNEGDPSIPPMVCSVHPNPIENPYPLVCVCGEPLNTIEDSKAHSEDPNCILNAKALDKDDHEDTESAIAISLEAEEKERTA